MQYLCLVYVEERIFDEMSEREEQAADKRLYRL